MRVGEASNPGLHQIEKGRFLQTMNHWQSFPSRFSISRHIAGAHSPADSTSLRDVANVGGQWSVSRDSVRQERAAAGSDGGRI